MDFLTSKVTTVLIVINIVIFLLETKDGGSTNRDVAIKYGVQYQPLIRQGQYYRLFTAMFLHFGVYHLLFNMYALSVIGPAVDYVCGSVIFLIVYLGAGLAGNVATMILDEKSGRSNLSARCVRLYLRASGGMLCACYCGVRFFNAQYFDNAGDQPGVRTVVEADQHDVTCGRICRRGGDHGGDFGCDLIAPVWRRLWTQKGGNYEKIT